MLQFYIRISLQLKLLPYMKNYQKYIDGSILTVTIFTLSKFLYQLLYIQITTCLCEIH